MTLSRMTDLSMTEPLTAFAERENPATVKSFSQRVKGCCYCGKRFKFILQCLHFAVSMTFLWAGVVEFINHPPYFDAYGDAKKNTDELPRNIMHNDPRTTERELRRLMDLPVLLLLLIYKAVCVWLKYKGASWLLTISLTITMIFFWVVNFGNLDVFQWKYYATRMNGLQLQVSSIALSATVIFMVIFYTRKKLPLKFKSSLRMKNNSKIHLAWNILGIYLILFATLMVWFTKIYASWALFRSKDDVLRLCTTTQQVECYPCAFLNITSLEECIKLERDNRFTCSRNFPSDLYKGSICIFNFNLGIYGFLMTFAYIGGLCVFLSTFLTIVGHYTIRGCIFVQETVLRLHYRSSDFVTHKRISVRRLRTRRRNQERTENDAENAASEPTELYLSDSDDDDSGLINSLTYEAP